MKRVVITGLGVVSPLGNDVNEMWGRLLNGDNAVDTLTKIDIDQYPAKVGAEVKSWDISHLVEPKEIRKMDSFIQYSILAADAAHKDSGLDVAAIPNQVGTWIGSGIGGGRDDRQTVDGPSRTRTAPHQPVLHPDDDSEHGERPSVKLSRGERAEQLFGHSMCVGDELDWGSVPRHSARRRTRDVRRRSGSTDHATLVRRILCEQGAVDESRP